MRTQFIVNENDIVKRGHFYDYITNNYKFKISYPFKREMFQKIGFPFVIDYDEKEFWVCRSVTCCACAAQAKVIITIAEFMEQEKEILKIKKYRKLLIDR